MDESSPAVRQKGETLASPNMTRPKNPPVESRTSTDQLWVAASPSNTAQTATGEATPTEDHDFQPETHRSIGNLPDQNTGHQKPHYGTPSTKTQWRSREAAKSEKPPLQRLSFPAEKRREPNTNNKETHKTALRNWKMALQRKTAHT